MTFVNIKTFWEFERKAESTLRIYIPTKKMLHFSMKLLNFYTNNFGASFCGNGYLDQFKIEVISWKNTCLFQNAR